MDRARVEELEALLAKATPGEWMLATSCSWRRILTLDGKPVIVPTAQRSDGHPDLECGQEHINAELAIAAVNALPALLRLARAVAEAPRGEVVSVERPRGCDSVIIEIHGGEEIADPAIGQTVILLRADAAGSEAGAAQS